MKKIKEISISEIRPNTWNPNSMNAAELAEYQNEVLKLGQIPKPLIVRPSGEGFEIIDGEHSFRCAKNLGWKSLPCEIFEVDDFEAYRQSYKRNLGGTWDKVKLGRMFAKAKAAKGLSVRGLAAEYDINYGKIQVYLDYARAADLFPGKEAEINGLGAREMREKIKAKTGKVVKPLNKDEARTSRQDKAEEVDVVKPFNTSVLLPQAVKARRLFKVRLFGRTFSLNME